MTLTGLIYNASKENDREQWRRSLAEAGLTLVDGSFEEGATANSKTDAVWYIAGGQCYTWNGAGTKTVPAKSTPESTGGVGSGEWLSVGDTALRRDLFKASGATIIGVEGGGTLQQALLIKTPEQFLAAGDGIADDTDAVQALFDYCAPFEWKGSIPATKAAWGKIRAIASGLGKYRITRPLKINPFLMIQGNYLGAFFGQNGGFHIIADFDDKDGFALDTACYDKTGVRVLGRKAGRNDWDNADFSGCPGWTLDGLVVEVKEGRNLRGVLNRAIGIQSSVVNCGFSGANIGIQTSCSWGGKVVSNNIIASAIAMYNSNDTTDDYQVNNYLSILGAKPSTTTFNYPAWPDTDLQGKTACLYNEYSAVVHCSNIWEKGEIGAMVTRSTAMHLDQIYAEALSESVIATHTVNLKFSPRVIACEQASLFKCRGASSNEIVIDLSAANIYSINKTFFKEAASLVKLYGTLPHLDLPFYAGCDYADIEFNGMRTIYVSDGGLDTHTGYSKDRNVKTVQEAMDRCGSGQNTIIVYGNVTTKYEYQSGGTTSNKIVDIHSVTLVSGGAGEITVGANGEEVHSLPMGIRNIKLVNLKINGNTTPAVTGGAYRSFIACNGPVTVGLEGVTHESGFLMGTKFNHSGFAVLTAKGSTIKGTLCAQGGASGFSWIDVGSPDTTATGSAGAGTKISSQLYP